MPQLELKTTVLNADVFHLFSEDGQPIALPDKATWTLYGDLENPWRKTSVELSPGTYWMIFATSNYASLLTTEVDETSVQKSEETSWDTGQLSVPVKTPESVFAILREHALDHQLTD